MYDPKNILYIISAIAAAEKAIHYGKVFITPTQLLEANDQMNFNATNTLLIAIAEEIKKTDKQLLQSQPHIQWQNIADMRNLLAHDYRGIDPEIVFSVVKNELPKLTTALVHILKLFPSNLIQEILDTKRYQHLQQIINQ